MPEEDNKSRGCIGALRVHHRSGKRLLAFEERTHDNRTTVPNTFRKPELRLSRVAESHTWHSPFFVSMRIIHIYMEDGVKVVHIDLVLSQ